MKFQRHGFDGCAVLVLGDLMLDEYIEGEARRLSPEAPVPVVEFARKRHVAGGAANVAVNISSLGGTALLGGLVGADAGAITLRTICESHGVDASGIQTDETRPTTTKTRILAGTQQMLRLDIESRASLEAGARQALLGWALARMAEADACVLSDYAKGLVTEEFAAAVIDSARRCGIPIIVDPKATSFSKYRGCSVVTPNLHELEAVAGRRVSSEADLVRAGEGVVADLGGASLLVTRGPQGMSLFIPGRAALHIASCAREVFDPTGAGDTVVATLALALSRSLDIETSVRLANSAAGIVVGKRGTATLTAAELGFHAVPALRGSRLAKSPGAPAPTMTADAPVQ